MKTRKHFSLLSIIYRDQLRDQAIKGHSILLFSLAFFYLSMTIFRRVKICPTNKHLYPLRFFSVCLSVTFFLPAKFFLPVCNLFIAKFTEELTFVIHFLKLIFFPIFCLKSSTHLSILFWSLLIHVISFMFFFFFLIGFVFPILNHALTRLWSLMFSIVL